MSDIIKATLEELSKHDVAGVEELVLVIGDLTNLGEDQMTFAFEVMSRDTILADAKLIIESEPIRLKCKVCDFDGPAEILRNEGYDHTIPVLSCPECSGPVNVTEGMACRIRSIKIREG
ncbi:MAG: hydrogenase maturation nickel metallochaperone HypA [Methanomassiliicoccaceae archaeon]|jgi:hydrogenase nickel incorporation protein HypA/HybF|nr:hydrogenase maturation nickel metallochaperone HypA [Methanomassiliicoccaceae archaeon]